VHPGGLRRTGCFFADINESITMFKNPVPFNLEKHRQLKLLPDMPWYFAAQQMMCPVVSGEIRQIAREYVIIFNLQSDKPPQALLGVEEGVNSYVASSGHWLCRYIPAHFRRYPFIAAPVPSKLNGGTDSRNFTLLVEEEAPHLSEQDGAALINEDGKPSEVLEKIQKVLVSLQQDFEATVQMVKQLEDYGLLTETNLRVKLKSGKEHGITGFRIIDTKALMALEGEKLAALQKTGALLLAYSHIISLANLRDGVLVNDKAREVGAANAPDWQSIFGPSDDGLDFSRLH
jgi:hypothetical protein